MSKVRPVTLLQGNEGIIAKNFKLSQLSVSSDKLCSVLEVRSHSSHSCCISSSEKYLAVIETVAGDNEPTSSVVLWVLDLENSKYYVLDTLKDCSCLEASFHPSCDVLAVVQSPNTATFYNVGERRITHKVEYSVLDDSEHIQGLSWCLPHTNPRQDCLLLCYTVSHCILYTPRDTNRLKLNNTIVWAGVMYEWLIVLDNTSSLQLWDTNTAALLSTTTLQPPSTTSSSALTHAALLTQSKTVIIGGESAYVISVSLPSCQCCQLPLPRNSTSVTSLTALQPSHAVYAEVVLLVDGAGVMHVYCPNKWTRLKTFQSDQLLIRSVSGCCDWLAITYSNKSTKVYPTMCLLPSEGGELKTKKKRVLSLQSTIEKVAGMLDQQQMSHDKEKQAQVKSVDEVDVKEGACKVKRTVERREWLEVLAEYGSFPAEQRPAIWSGLLSLPRSASLHAALLRKPLHSAVPQYANMEDSDLRESFRSLLSCLYHWAPALSTASWVPSFVFPFHKVLRNSSLVCFELCVSLLMSWCRLLFSPASECSADGSPPAAAALAAVEVLIADASPRLLALLIRSQVTVHTYAWPLMSSAFANVLSPDDWLNAWDHLLSQPPSFMVCFTAAFTLCLQPTLSATQSTSQIELLYSQETFIPLKAILKKAYNIHKDMKLDAPTMEALSSVSPFPKGGLPVFDNIKGPQTLIDTACEDASHGTLSIGNWSLDDDEVLELRKDLSKREEECFQRVRDIRGRHLELWKESAR